MADNWRFIDLSHFKGGLRFQKEKLDIINRDSGEVSSIALSDVNIMLIGVNVTLAPAVLYHLGMKDVVVIMCDWKGLPISALYPWSNTHGRIAARHRAQASLSIPRQKNAWARIVKAKIMGQANVMELKDTDVAKQLQRLASTVRSGDPSNIEAQAAKLYWGHIFKSQSFSRKPGIGDSGYNAMLDYAYTVLRGHSIRAVISAGLSPTLGLYHRNRTNTFALADDLIEPFRPAIDSVVSKIAEDANLEDADIRKELAGASHQIFSSEEKSIPAVMTSFAQHYGRYVEGEIDSLTVPVWKTNKQETVV